MEQLQKMLRQILIYVLNFYSQYLIKLHYVIVELRLNFRKLNCKKIGCISETDYRWFTQSSLKVNRNIYLILKILCTYGLPYQILLSTTTPERTHCTGIVLLAPKQVKTYFFHTVSEVIVDHYD